MPNPYRDPDKEAMSGEVDRLLRQLGPEWAERSRAVRSPTPRSQARSAPAEVAAGHAPDYAELGPPSALGVWGRVLLGAALAWGLIFWPYRFCGVALGTYGVGVLMLLIAGVWAAHAAWRARLGYAHVIAILLLFAAAALGARQVVPHVGYGPVQTDWRCSR
jgi:hypothetical protein